MVTKMTLYCVLFMQDVTPSLVLEKYEQQSKVTEIKFNRKMYVDIHIINTYIVLIVQWLSYWENSCVKTGVNGETNVIYKCLPLKFYQKPQKSYK